MTSVESILSAVIGKDLPECESPNRTWKPGEPYRQDVYELWKFGVKADLWEGQLMRCYYCGCSLENVSGAHLEHMTPLKYHGTNDPDNLALACERCNLLKGTMTAEEFVSWVILEEQDTGERVLPTPEGFVENPRLDPNALTSNLR